MARGGGWQWIDGDNDGTAECYYFGADGYMLSGATTADGYTVNADGAWVENGAVQVQAAASPAGHNAAPAQAGWYHDGTGWRYRRIDGLEGYDIWVWSDRDNDGTSELYYFQDEEFGSYLLEGGVSPDGYTVSAEGARMVNGAVLTQPAAPAYAPANTYNSQGVSNIALEMVDNTREENAKFGEVEIITEDDHHRFITYANGFCMDYDNFHGYDYLSRASDQDRKLLFKYYDSSLTSDEVIESYLLGLGVGFKGGAPAGPTQPAVDAVWSWKMDISCIGARMGIYIWRPASGFNHRWWNLRVQ